MVIPHGGSRPKQFSFSLPLVAALFLAWTGLTGWAGYVASQRFDYWRARANSYLLTVKLQYFAEQPKSSREMIGEVKAMDQELRTLLGLGSRDAIIQTDAPAQRPGAGGPTLGDAAELERTLAGAPDTELSFEKISEQFAALRAEAQRRKDSFHEINRKIIEERRLYRATPNLWPVNGYLTSGFGQRISPFSGFTESHKGLDIADAPGTPVRATADGVVMMAGWAGGYGKVVVIDHGYGYSTRYGHNRQVLVKPGDRVKRGQIVALVGETGNATGPHCHYEVWYQGRALNPTRFLRHHYGA
jgi:murein DD-endopeptidase MepM/ murein hydrolase activator NlpD